MKLLRFSLMLLLGWPLQRYNDNLVFTPAYLRSGAFYLLAESGSGFLQPTKLIGAVTYESDEAAAQISLRAFSGKIRGAAGAQPVEAGFVIYSPARPMVTRIDGLTKRNQEPRLSVRQEGSENVLTFADRGKLIVIDRKPVKYPVLQSAALFNFAQGRRAYLAIRWAPDKDCVEACCEHAYSLYRIGDVAELVLENFYDCDV